MNSKEGFVAWLLGMYLMFFGWMIEMVCIAAIVFCFKDKTPVLGVFGISGAIINAIIYIHWIKKTREWDKEEKERKQELLLAEKKAKEERERRILNSPIRNLTPLQFEEFTALYFKKRGYTNIDLTPVSGDFGADIIAYNPEGKKVCIQCKKYSSPVGVSAVQEIISAKLYYQCEIAMVAVGSAGFTRQAKELASKTGIILYTFDDVLHEFILEDKSRTPSLQCGPNTNSTHNTVHVEDPVSTNTISQPFTTKDKTNVPTIASSPTSKNSSTTIIRNTVGQPKETTIKEPVSDIKCDKCGAMMIYKNGRFGRFLACSNYPACRNTKSIIEVVEGVTCPKCKSSIIKKYTSHRIFYGCENYPKCDFYTYDIPVKIKCPKCGGVMVQKSDDKGVFVQCLNSSCKEILRRMKKAD